MKDNYECWNDTSVAHMFVRLITKTNHPFNHDPLTFETYKKNYDNLQGYINWHEKNNINKWSLYNFTQENMKYIFNKLDYNVNNKDQLFEFWNKEIVKIK